MKKNLLFVLLLVFLSACSKEALITPGQLGFDGITGNEIIISGSTGSDSPNEVILKGGSDQVTARVDFAAENWCSVKVNKVTSAQSEEIWKLVITTEEYTGNESRKAYISVNNSIDELTLIVTQTGRGKTVEMIVVSEGQFTKGTASLSAITYDGTTTWNIFQDVNQMPLGDVAQSISYIDGKYFVVLNNSRQIKVIEPQTFKLLGTIDYEQSASPRFMVPINDSEAIVSDLMRQLTKVNYKTYEVLEYINLSGTGVSQIEKMTKVGNKIFCAALGKGVVVLDSDNISNSPMRFVEGFTGNIMKTAKMILDKNNKLWVFATASGKTVLNCIDPATEKVVKTVEIPYAKAESEDYVVGCITGTSGYNRMDTDRTRGKLYFYMTMLVNVERKTAIGAIFTLDVDKDAIDPIPYRELPGLGMMYGMGISPDGDVYLCDCLNYTAQRGFLRKYKADGSVESKRVGIYPRMVHFTEYDK
ncbi:MAG: hypothetical protein M0R23_07100 [Bacteroidales bacterium]|nr:hypothetical protein [Bacteroidales bacterium]